MLIVKFFTNNKFLLASLKEQELYFNPIGRFNDPFEGIFRFKLWNDAEKVREFYMRYFDANDKLKIDYYINHPTELEKKINEIFEYRAINNAVCCFSEIGLEQNILMWAHYANNQAGVCLIFESNDLVFQHGKKAAHELIADKRMMTFPTGPHEVVYTDKYLNTDPLNGNLNQKTFLTTKFEIWKYEKEVRFIAPKEGGYNFKPIALKKVIFGLRTPKNFKVAVKNIIDKSYKGVCFEHITLKDSDFAFQNEPELFI